VRLPPDFTATLKALLQTPPPPAGDPSTRKVVKKKRKTKKRERFFLTSQNEPSVNLRQAPNVSHRPRKSILDIADAVSTLPVQSHP